MRGAEGSVRPLEDFARLYGCGLDPDDESKHIGQLPITARMAYYLWATSSQLHDHWREWAKSFDPDDPEAPWQDDLPPIAVRHANADWLARFAQCFGDIASRLRSGQFGDYGITNCTGDEVAVSITLTYARDLVADGEIYTPPQFNELLPSCGDDDIDFDLASCMVSADDDVEALWDPARDGIEIDPDSTNRYVNLHPLRWFLPFE
jgi:hypothetical protein